MKACRREGRKVRGPPVHRTGGMMSAPCASVVMVCIATALNIEAAMSDVGRRRDTRFWTSVLANTPHREAMG